ncbi:MAG: class I SAM-dependent methyltransferase [Boseongicola sp.]|nr:class I SAM-dependent methyltransferase [Boseongicola sp.]
MGSKFVTGLNTCRFANNGNTAKMTDDPDLESAYALETPEDNKRLYRNWAETYDSDFVEAKGFRFPALVAESYMNQGGHWPCLDVGCGTGAIAEHFPDDAVLDGLDISPEMLAVAERKSRYRALFEANLKEPLDLPSGIYAGFVSSGTFTHGHVGAEALPELIRVLAPGALAVHTVKADLWAELGFEETFEVMTGDGLITRPVTVAEQIYEDGSAPDGHQDDVGLIVSFRRL